MNHAFSKTKRLPPLNWLRAFEASARSLSFTTAAEELHMTQSAVSQQIKSLEHALGRTLFLRRVRGLELTEDALAYLPTVQAAFSLLAQGTSELTGRNQPHVLELQSNLSFTIFWLTPRLEKFLEANPWVQLNLATPIWAQDKPSSTVALEILFGQGQWDSRVGKRLTHETLFPVCSPSLAQKINTIDDLLEQRLLDLPGTLESWEHYLESYPHLSTKTKKIPMVHRVSTWAVSLQWAKAGLGVALAHDTIAKDLLESGELIRPLAFSMPMKEAYYLIAPEGLETHSAAHTFKQWLLAEMEKPGKGAANNKARV